MRLTYSSDLNLTPVAIDVISAAKQEVYGETEIEFDAASTGADIGFGKGEGRVAAPSVKQLESSATGMTDMVNVFRLVQRVAHIPHEFPWSVIETEEEIEHVHTALGKKIVVDIEVAGDIDIDMPWETPIISLAVYDGKGRVYVIAEELCETAAVAELLRDRALIGHNAKFDVRTINHRLDTNVYAADDTMLMYYAMNHGSKNKGLKTLAKSLLGAPEWEGDLKKWTVGGAHYENIPRENLYTYNAGDVWWTWYLYELFYEQLEQDPPRRTLYQRIMQITNMLQDIEDNGVGSDEQFFIDYSAELKHEADKMLDILKTWVVNPGSWQQVQRALSNMGHEVKSTDVKTLEKLLDRTDPSGPVAAFVSALLDFRGFTKLRSTYAEGVLKRMRNGVLYPQFLSHGTTTGRLACVAGDTLVDMPRDMTKYPDGVPISEVKEGDWVYSFDYHMNLTLRQVEWVGPTKIDETVLVKFQNSDGEERILQCTPDHLVRLYSGDYRPAAYLMKRGGGNGEGATTTRALGMVRRGWKEDKEQYIQFFPHANSRQTPPSVTKGQRYGSMSGGRRMEHRWILEQVLGKKLSTKFDVHHKDGNKANNHPSNLEYLSPAEHRQKHTSEGLWRIEQPGSDVHVGKTDWRVVDIEQGPVIEVWDMTVPVDHCFVANGIVVHNSKNPNVQNLPRTSRVREGFIAKNAADGHIVVSCDYSQIELRTMAELSGDAAMIAAFDPDKEDIFDAMMPAAFPELGMPYAEYKAQDPKGAKEKRALVKGIVYGQSYGRGVPAIAEALGLSLQEAQRIVDAYFDTYPGLAEWRKKVIKAATDDSLSYMLTTPFGRQYQAEVVTFRNQNAVENAALAFMPQSTANDICLTAAMRVHERAWDYGYNIVSLIHDAIVAEGPSDTAEPFIRMMQREMVGAAKEVFHRVEFAVESTIGDSWATL